MKIGSTIAIAALLSASPAALAARFAPSDPPAALPAAPESSAITLAADAEQLPLTRGRVISGVSSGARRAINLDGLVHAWAIGNLDLTKPLPNGASLAVPAAMKDSKSAQVTWTDIQANDQGAFHDGLRPGSTVWIEVTSPTERVMILEASGHSLVYVNGQPRMGDPYATGFVKLPVLLKQGSNIFVFASAGRGDMRAQLVKPPSTTPYIAAEDRTIPDLVGCPPGATTPKRTQSQLAVVVVNPTNRPVSVNAMSGDPPALHEGDATASDGPRALLSGDINLPSLGATKVNVPFEALIKPGDSSFEVKLTLVFPEGLSPQPLPSSTQKLNIVPITANRRVTFTSDIDGSCQYYSVLSPKDYTGEPSSTAPALVLSLHGASVEAPSQTGSYAPKENIVIVSPTNRRPFGFDWEDWGRIDGLEVLEHARADFHTDRSRQYVTGHSMGGHGTWQFGVLFPDQFAVVAPSAGWLSFETYGNKGKPTEYPGTTEATASLESALRAAGAASDTPAQLSALVGRPVAILHGDADDNVPVTEARAAHERLLAMGFSEEPREGEPARLYYHEQKGAGHWWGNASSGAACLDWAPFFELFKATSLAHPAGPATAFSQTGGAADSRPLLDRRGFAKGSFKRVFDRNFVLVYGTTGTPEENSWSMATARFDTEQWWVTGNGGTHVVSDTDFAARAAEFAGRNIIFYGNADTNSAWKNIEPTLRASRTNPPHIFRGSIQGFGEDLKGEDLAILFAAEQTDAASGNSTPTRTIALIGGTGLAGMRAIERAPIFRSGAGIPEVLVLRAKTWSVGMPGIERAGTMTNLATASPTTEK